MKLKIGISAAITAIGAVMAGWIGSVLFNRGIEVDEANATGYSTVAEKTILFSGLGLFAIGAVLLLVFVIAALRKKPAVLSQ